MHPIVLIRTEKMNIREIIKEVEYIYYFSGGVAFFRAKDEKGSYQGLIDKEGEIVWDIKWRTPALRLSAFPNYIKTGSRNVSERVRVPAHGAWLMTPRRRSSSKGLRRRSMSR